MRTHVHPNWSTAMKALSPSVNSNPIREKNSRRRSVGSVGSNCRVTCDAPRALTACSTNFRTADSAAPRSRESTAIYKKPSLAIVLTAGASGNALPAYEPVRYPMVASSSVLTTANRLPWPARTYDSSFVLSNSTSPPSLISSKSTSNSLRWSLAASRRTVMPTVCQARTSTGEVD